MSISTTFESSPWEGQSLYSNYRLWLESELKKRIEKNPKYSLRAFAQLFKMSPAQLSRILSGKRALSLSVAQKMTKTLHFDDRQNADFLKLVVMELQYRERKTHTNKKNEFEENAITVARDCIKVFAHIHHFALRELIQIKGRIKENDEQIRKLAYILTLAPYEVQDAIHALERANLLERTPDGYLVAKTKTIVAPNFESQELQELKSEMKHALRSLHRDSLQQAISAIEDVPLNERDISFMVIPVDEAKLEKAKQKIKKFRREMSEFLSEGEPGRIYHLAVQLYPVSKRCK